MIRWRFWRRWTQLRRLRARRWLGQVLRGADLVTTGVDICPSFAKDNLDRLSQAIGELDAQTANGERLEVSERVLADRPVLELVTSVGELKVIAAPVGVPNGYVDLRRAASHEHLGAGVRPLVASTSDLAARRRPVAGPRTCSGSGRCGGSSSWRPTAARRSARRASLPRRRPGAPLAEGPPHALKTRLADYQLLALARAKLGPISLDSSRATQGPWPGDGPATGVRAVPTPASMSERFHAPP